MNQKKLSDLSKVGFAIQGWTCGISELSEHKLGIRFAYGLCALLILIGLILKLEFVLFVSLCIAVLGIFLPNHSIDYLYNALFRHLWKKPSLPNRPPQARFACFLAFLWLAMALVFYSYSFYWIYYIMGGALIMQASIVTFTDICFPSMIYNWMFELNIKEKFTC